MVLVVVQFIFYLFTSKINNQLQSANNSLHGFFNDSLNFLSFNTDAKPWPFNSNDAEEPEMQEEVVKAEAVEPSSEEPKAEDPA